jgi:hypothetical protein
MSRVWAAGAIAAICAGGASAHHSYAGYDRCKTFTVVGEIERVSWVNPHVVFTIKTAEGESYLIQWLDVGRLERAGVSVDDLEVGDEVVVSGSANRDPNVHIVTLLTAVRRPSDGWQWSEPLSSQCSTALR